MLMSPESQEALELELAYALTMLEQAQQRIHLTDHPFLERLTTLSADLGALQMEVSAHHDLETDEARMESARREVLERFTRCVEWNG